MADQDFKINIRATADIGAIRLTQQQLEALQKSAAAGNKQAITALNQLATAQKAAASSSSVLSGLAGGVIGGFGVGAATSAISVIVNQWRQLNEEQDRMIENMEKAREKNYELGLALVDTLEAMRSAERIDTEPLEVSFNRLTQDVRRLKTEIELAFGAGAYDDANKLIKQLNIVESQVDRVTAALEKQNDERDKARQKERAESESFTQGALGTASPQVKAALMNEFAGIRAGPGIDRDLFERTAESFKRGFTPAQQQEYEGLTGAGWDKLYDAIQTLSQKMDRQLDIWR